MSEKYPKLDEKTLDEMNRYVGIRLPKINDPIQPLIVRDGVSVCTCGQYGFNTHDEAGYMFSYCLECGQRYYHYLGS